MKSFFLSSGLFSLFLLTSCSPGILKGFYKAETTTISRNDVYPFFHFGDSAHYFNMQIDFRKNHLSGMLIIKEMEPGVYRAVLNSYFGMGIFDMEFSENHFQVYQCMEVLNKKQVINTLKNDFIHLLFVDFPDRVQAQTYRSKQVDSDLIYQVKIKDHTGYYWVNTDSEELKRLDFPHFFSTLRYDYTNYCRKFPEEIRIAHSRVGLKLQLDKISR